MKLLFVVSVLCTTLYTFAQPAEKKPELLSAMSANAQKVAEQKKQESAAQVPESAKDDQAVISSGLIKVNPARRAEKLNVAESMYHSLPMPFVNYPFPFVNSYTSRYFPYGYALGFDNVLARGGLGYGGLGGYGSLGYAYGYGGWF